MARTSTTRATLLLVSVFLAGGLVGGATMRVVDQERHEGRDGNSTPRLGYVERLTTELSLTSEQRQAVEEILRRHEPRTDSLWRAMRNSAEIEAVRQSIRSEIRSQLTTEQQERYAAMLERQGRDEQKGGRGGNDR